MSDLIKLPTERAEQLRTLSKNLNMSIADCIAMFINEQIAKGNLTNDLPGTSVERAGEAVKFDVGAFRSVLPKDLAKTYAERIRSLTRPVLAPSKNNPFIPDFKLDVVRRGMSVKLIDRTTGAEKTMSRSVAEDFAANLARSASDLL